MSTLSQFVGGGGAVKSVQRGTIALYNTQYDYGGGYLSVTANISPVDPAKSVVLIYVTITRPFTDQRIPCCQGTLINSSQLTVSHGVANENPTIHYQVIEYL